MPEVLLLPMRIHEIYINKCTLTLHHAAIGICLAGFNLNNVDLCIVYACDQGSYYCILFSGIISVFISCIVSVLIFSIVLGM